MANKRTDVKLVIGGVPRARLLPPELKQEERNRAQLRLLGFVVVVVVAATAGAYAFSAVVADASHQRLTAANTQTDDLLAAQGQYVEVRQLAAQVQASKDAATVGMATDVDWSQTLSGVEASITNIGATTTSVTLAAETPLVPLVLPTSPLEKPRVAQLTIIAVTPTLLSSADWLRALEKIPGFADVTVSSIKTTESGYEATLVLHLSNAIYTNRFAADAPGETDGDADESETP